MSVPEKKLEIATHFLHRPTDLVHCAPNRLTAGFHGVTVDVDLQGRDGELESSRRHPRLFLDGKARRPDRRHRDVAIAASTVDPQSQHTADLPLLHLANEAVHARFRTAPVFDVFPRDADVDAVH